MVKASKWMCAAWNDPFVAIMLLHVEQNLWKVEILMRFLARGSIDVSKISTSIPHRNSVGWIARVL